MSFSLVKDILLVLLGAFITFIFTLLINKIQRREPKIEWRKLPDIAISSQGLSGLSWLIENTGRSSSKNVRITFTLPEKATFQSFEVETSEPALEYNIIDQPEIRKKTIEIQTFPQNITVSVSALVSDLADKNVQLSIVGDEVVGTKKRGISSDEIDRIRKNFKWFYVGLYAILVITGIIGVTGIIFICNESMQLKQTQHIAEIHERQKKYDDAIEIYKVYQENSIFFHNFPRVNYNIAKLYSMKNDLKRCLVYLKNAIKKDKKFINIIESEEIFDTTTSTTEYKNFIKEISKK